MEKLNSSKITLAQQKEIVGGRNFIIIEDELLLRTLNPYIIIEDVSL